MPPSALVETSSLTPHEKRRGMALVLGLGAFVTLLALALSEPPAARAGRALSFWLLSLPPLLLARAGWLQWARRNLGRWHVWAGALLVAAIAPDRLARGSWTDLAGIALYVAIPILLTLDRPRGGSPLLRDLPLVLLLWLPLELGMVTGDFVLLRLLGLDLLLLLFVVERAVWEPGTIVPTRRRDWEWGIGMWLAFIAIAIPLAMATGFAFPGVSDRSGGDWALFLVSTFWIIALPEEALFRGAIQTLLHRWTGRLWPALIIASVVFGLSHLNNDGPDWRYVVLASIAGVAYGIAYVRTGSIAAPTMTHFLVDVTWRGFFAG